MSAPRRPRRQTLAVIARAEALYAFADSLTEPGPPLLCAAPRHRTLSFRELVNSLKDSVGRDAEEDAHAGRAVRAPRTDDGYLVRACVIL